MKCPFCGHDRDRVVDSRSRNDGRAIRRRRLCAQCGRRFITIEEVEDKTLYVIKSDGRREIFNTGKLRRGIQIACSKRPISVNDIESMVQQIESELNEGFVKEIESRVIGEMVSQRLKEIDEVAYVRFTSVYRKFKDSEEFLKELRELIGRQGIS
ncbi:MAG TPA: transcriptional repressor NrdR [bacterium]|nr:transcriptional repressor NrdR [bacterium]